MSFVPTKIPLKEIIVGIVSRIRKIHFQNQDIARKECFNLIKKNLFKIIQELKKKDCFYLKSDNENYIVVLGKKPYGKE